MVFSFMKLYQSSQRCCLFVLLLGLLYSCVASKEVPVDKLYGPIWEVEYLAGPGTNLADLFEGELPYFQFDKKDQRIFGSTGCNGYTVGFKIEGNSIDFGQPGISTLRYCGEGENEFKRAMQAVNRWSISEDGKLFLSKGDIPIMRLKKQ